MTRIKRGVQTHKRHGKLLQATRGYKLGRSKLFRAAKQAWLKAGQFAYRDRRIKKRVFRRLWIVQLNAAARLHGVSYKDLIYGLNLAGVVMNRKVLAELSYQSPEDFARVMEKVKDALQKESVG